MAHGTPGVLWVGTEVGGAVLANGEAGGGAGEGQVDETAFVDGGLEGVRITLLVQFQGDVVSGKGKHALVEHVVVDRVGEPDVGSITGGVEDLAIELSGSMDATGSIYTLDGCGN
jgi:hypothetical protein